LDLYSQAVSSQKREASAKVVEMLMPNAAKPPRLAGLSQEDEEALIGTA
jgi:hypothetical protein